uniref:Uncharacterized protein n=1 Tax=Anguilla anguilla TaxID=7936 RepID=A0A0E9SL46_ANGAN
MCICPPIKTWKKHFHHKLMHKGTNLCIKIHQNAENEVFDAENFLGEDVQTPGIMCAPHAKLCLVLKTKLRVIFMGQKWPFTSWKVQYAAEYTQTNRNNISSWDFKYTVFRGKIDLFG